MQALNCEMLAAMNDLESFSLLVSTAGVPRGTFVIAILQMFHVEHLETYLISVRVAAS